MLACEWRELEAIGNVIANMLQRRSVAQRSLHPEMAEALDAEIRAATGTRDRLVHRIAVRLGSGGVGKDTTR